MRTSTHTTGAHRARINFACYRMILDTMELYHFNPRYCITVEFIPQRGINKHIDSHIKHFHNVSCSFINSNRWYDDTPGIVYIKEKHRSDQYHLHIVMEEIPTVLLQRIVGKSFLVCSKSEPVAPDQFSQLELAFIQKYTEHLRRHVRVIGGGKDSIDFAAVYEIKGLVNYVNKSIFLTQEVTIDHVDLEYSSIFNQTWRNNRIQMLNNR